MWIGKQLSNSHHGIKLENQEEWELECMIEAQDYRQRQEGEDGRKHLLHVLGAGDTGRLGWHARPIPLEKLAQIN